jgi:uncharacterized protein with HEPN domain
MSKRDIKIILKDILKEIDNISKFTEGINYENFVSDEMRYYATIRCLELIGESVRQLSEQFKEANPEIEWRKIVDLRNILIHEYFEIEPEIIWDVIKNEIPNLKYFILVYLDKN